ncbi:MAG: M56 family metallopeptidase, partial [Gorillibacterium sp.]|nr:M56 family metallopeptidase [Gorillibacterium sp.]
PKVTVGIPAMNTFIRDSLPAAPPTASVNPLQIWLLIGTILWCIGIATLLFYSIISLIRLKRQIATAIRLKDNVFESDRIRSPFVLGFIHPRIYLPFGLSAKEQAYILKHEAYHVKRKDPLIKVFGFLLLAIHWFNPLVWLAFAWMTRDMEMSCDEKVLDRADASMAKDYSRSLLAFATNRRFPVAGPLAFGESAIGKRVKNILHFQKPKKGVTLLATTACILVIASCAFNPMAKLSPKESEALYGQYEFQKQVYMNPLSSFIALDGFKESYTLSEDTLVISDQAGNEQSIPVRYERVAVDEQGLKNSFSIDVGTPDLTQFKDRIQYTLNEASSSGPSYRLYLMNDEIWIARMKNDKIWSIYQIAKVDPARQIGVTPPPSVNKEASITGTTDGVEAFLALQKNFKSGYDTDKCFNITPAAVKENSDYKIFKYAASSASFLLYDGKVYPLGEWFGGSGVTSIKLADLDEDGQNELYFTYSWGSGLNRSYAAYFNPTTQQVTTFSSAHLNKDLMVVDNGSGGLALYEASFTSMDSFVNIEMKATKHISDIVFKEGQITLDPNSL